LTGNNADSRIGIFLCRCGHCISGAFDVERVAESSLSLPNVAHVQVEDFLCTKEGIAKMKDAVGLFSLDKVIVGACSPLLYLEKFRSAFSDVGVSRNAVEMVNLREQCGSIHWRYPRLGTVKACDQVKMVVAKVNVTRPSFEGFVPVLDPEICNGCGVCMDVCRAKSIQITNAPEKRWRRVAIVDGKTCIHCGACVSVCPSGARDMGSRLSDQVLAQIDAITSRGLARDLFDPRIVVFLCNWCTYFTADLAGVMKLEILPHFLSIKVPCCSEIDPEWILKAFARGIDGILVVAGRQESCRHDQGYTRSKRRLALINTMLMRLGLGNKRLKVCWMDPNEAETYIEEVSRFIELIRGLGPNPLRMKISYIQGVGPVPAVGQKNLEPDEDDQDISESSESISFEGAPQ
jgi:coenzyme F420-reducing hydrogenase delta subunit/NAD-dependent dihydropyrimidine dehydrogenase PreA subunit